MASPELQTVLTLTSGSSDQKTKAFRWGTKVEPIPVGTRAEWYVHAPGVLGVHLYVAFDGRMVHVAAAPGARVTARGTEVGQEWRAVPVRTEVRFGDASFAITCEEVPLYASPTNAIDAAQLGTGFTTAPPPSPGLVRTLIVRETKPPAQPAERKPAPAAAPIVNTGPGDTRPIAVVATPVAVAPAARIPATPAVPAEPAIVPTAIMSPATFTPAGAKPAPPLRPVVLEPPAPGEVPPAAPAPHEAASQYDSSPTTMIDGGALRDHAHRIASMAPDQAEAAAQEYAALLKRRAGHQTSDPPALTMSFGAQQQDEKREPAAVVAPPEAQKAATPFVECAKTGGLKDRFAKSWKETSNAKKAILFLLPFAAAATLLERDPQPAEPPAPAEETQVASKAAAKHAAADTATPTAPASAPAPSVPAASASAPAPSVPAASASASAPSIPAASASAPSAPPAIPVASAAPVARAPASAAPSAGVTATPVTSASRATPASAAKLAANGPALDPKAQTDDQADVDARASALEHMALAAAFGGNLAHAATVYAKLAQLKPEAQVFALAARLTKEGAVRTP
jgi:hypothetical protein